MIKISDAQYEQDVTNSPIPVLVDFYADWCMPCRMLAPMLAKLETEFSGKVTFAKLDTDTDRTKAAELKVSALPTMVIVKGGQVVRTFVGLVKEDDIRIALSDVTREGNG